MAELKLYKNKSLVLTKTGIKNKKMYMFDNIVYDPDNCLLIKEDNGFKYMLDFKNGKSEVTIKENNYSIDLQMNVTNMKLDKDSHIIYYNIESEKLIQNYIVITF